MARRWRGDRDLRLARWIVGVLCGFMLVGLAFELSDGVVRWASDPIGGRPSSASQRGHHSSSSLEGIVFFGLSFVVPSATGLGFALFPRVFGHRAVWGPAVILTLVGFAGLTFLQD